MANAKKKAKTMLSSFSIILILIFGLGILSHLLPNAKFVGEEIVNGSGTVGATLSQVLMAPISGFENAVDVGIFIMILGGMLAVVNQSGALETGIKVLVHKLKGKEIWLIPILMTIFSICGTTYGMLEETVGFYVLLAATMMAAGMDPLVGSAIVLLGAGTGCLGSTVNPFATGVALSSLPEGIAADNGLVILIAVFLWLTSLIVSIIFVMSYAKKVQKDKGSTFLSLREQKNAENAFGNFAEGQKEEPKLSGKQKATLIVFALAFVVMIIGFIPWGEFGVTLFNGWSNVLTGAPLGEWYFYDSALWFLILSIIIAVINGLGEKGYVDAFVSGAADMVGVLLVIAIARGASILMTQTHLDNYIVYNAAEALSKLPEVAFVPLNYLLHVILSFLVPSSSGLATLSTPIIAPIAAQLGYSVEVAIMTMVAANGLVNLITPTCGAIMGGLALAKVEYSTWFKWAIKIVIIIGVLNIFVLSIFGLIL
ncbi:arginine/ornithine antiporter [Clostridium sp. CAG:609]|nr:arginine/ornithine antiporter [Clostridium sp. CAG:609]